MQRPVRVGVVGMGFGAAVHVPAIVAMAGIELVGIVGRRLEKVEKLAENLGLPPEIALADLDELIARQPDIVTIALPPNEAESVALRVIAAGCAVLCEKPLAGTAQSAKRLVDAAAAANVPTAMDFQFPLLPAFVELQARVSSGMIGSIRSVTVTWLTQSYAHKHGKWSWKSDAAREGGVLTLLASHIFYLAEWLLGPVKSVSAAFDNKATQAYAPAGAVAAEDFVDLRLVHESGVVFSAVVGNAFPGIHRHLWHVAGAHGSLVMDNPTVDHMSGFRLTGTGQAAGTHWEDEENRTADSRIPPFRALLEQFVRSLEHKGRVAFSPNFQQGLRVNELMQAARQSAELGSVVLLSPQSSDRAKQH